jgi:hypothetical protein
MFSLALAALLALPVHAQVSSVELCFSYDCKQQAPAWFTSRDMDQLRDLLTSAEDAQSERALLGLAIGRMYAVAAAQTPIWRDRGRNGFDERDLEGAMDCVDHSTNTDAFLRFLAQNAMLRFHAPAGREVRFALLVFGEHWAASVIETANGQPYAVDSWFFDPGFPAIVVTLDRWKAGFDPDQTAETSR